jgi:AcrR family transcriptional regulator
MPRLSRKRKELIDAMMKDAIFDAAVSVLAEHGVKGMTMDRVAAAAHLAKASLYGYVGSKQKLLGFVHGRVVEPILEMVAETARAERPPAAKLDAIVRIIYGEVEKHQGIFTILLTDDTARRLLEPSARPRRETAIAQLAEVFRQGIDQGVFRDFDPRRLAEIFFAAMTEPWKWAASSGNPPVAERWIGPLVEVFLHGIAANSDR